MMSRVDSKVYRNAGPRSRLSDTSLNQGADEVLDYAARGGHTI